MCVKDCGPVFIFKNINMVICFEILVGWLDSSPVELKKMEATIVKKRMGMNTRFLLYNENFCQILILSPKYVKVKVNNYILPMFEPLDS